MAKNLSSLYHRLVDLFRLVRLWVLAVGLICVGAALLFFDRDGLVFGQSIGAILAIVGVVLAVLNLPKQQQKKMIESAKDAKEILTQEGQKCKTQRHESKHY